MDDSTKASVCCSNRGGGSKVCPSGGRVICNDGWVETGCLYEGMTSSTDNSLIDPYIVDSTYGSVDALRKVYFSGLMRGTLGHLSELIGEACDFGDPSQFESLSGEASRYVFKVEDSKGGPKVSVLRPFKVHLDQVLYKTPSALTVQGIKLVRNAVAKEECHELVKAEFESIEKARPYVLITRSIDCLSGRFRMRWAGRLKRRVNLRSAR